MTIDPQTLAAALDIPGGVLEVLRQVAPGTALRPGLERILRAGRT